MHSSFSLFSIAFAFAFLVVQVAPIPAIFPESDSELELEQYNDDGNLFSSSNLFFNDLSPIYSDSETGVTMEELEQSFIPVSISPANNLLLQSMDDETYTDTGLSWDTGTGIGTDTGGGGGGGEELLDDGGGLLEYFDSNEDLDFSDLNDNNNFDLVASVNHEPYTSPDISPGDFDDYTSDPLAKCPMDMYRYAACCGRGISLDQYIPDCTTSEFFFFLVFFCENKMRNIPLRSFFLYSIWYLLPLLLFLYLLIFVLLLQLSYMLLLISTPNWLFKKPQQAFQELFALTTSQFSFVV